MNKKIEKYSQCRFTRELDNGARMETTAYVDAREARVGTLVTLKGVEGVWAVASAGPPGPPPRHTNLGAMD
jgi:hypothetical protein